jgi:hypothetical protein
LLKRLAAPEWVFNFGIFFSVLLDFGKRIARRGPLETGISPLL